MAIELCSKCGKPGEPVEEPLYMGKIEPLIKANVCLPCWTEWTNMRVMVINELRLNLGDPSGREQLKQQMWTFLNLPKDE
ncbi:MAG TPA: Fe-S cluster protector protein [Nitrospirales bacterium]|nr:Fe-S cluster protector protein [Nitrospirales bacterium]HIC04827.1 Fe-S cluster protector protein [Nitrospirales bacterium]HIN33114.1 Fe-S cluster protector protein [Nitrospirales bacterium]HIO21723.1 Fe-S cluster protector protein [Nitrospirales bacterium]